MIFAAGLGTRMGALTATRPKPMIEVAGRTLLDRTIDLAEEAGAAPLVANTHYLPESMRPTLSARGIVESHEPGTLLDTGGGLKAALRHLPGDIVATMNSDAVFAGPNPVRHLLSHGLPDDADALLLTVPMTRAVARTTPGDFTLGEDGRLTRRGDRVYTGLQLIRTAPVAAQAERVFSFNLLWDVFAANGRLLGLDYPGHWCDVGHPGGIAEAEAMLAAAP